MDNLEYLEKLADQFSMLDEMAENPEIYGYDYPSKVIAKTEAKARSTAGKNGKKKAGKAAEKIVETISGKKPTGSTTPYNRFNLTMEDIKKNRQVDSKMRRLWNNVKARPYLKYGIPATLAAAGIGTGIYVHERNKRNRS